MAVLVGAFFLFDIVVTVLIVVYVSKRRRATTPEQERAPKQRGRAAGVIGFAVFTLIWSTAILCFDVWVAHGLINQSRTQHFAACEGKVLHCAVKEESDSDGTSYSVEIEYAYQVQGQEYTGTRVRYLTIEGRSWVEQFVADHPAGSPITVYHDPADPDSAVLVAGFDGSDLFMPLFLLPFNMVMLALWVGAPLSLFRRSGNNAGLPFGTRVFESEAEFRVRLSRFPPFIAAFVTLTCGSIPVVVCVAFCSGLAASGASAIIGWVVVLGGSALVYLLLARRAAAGRDDLVLDRLHRTLTLPQTFGRTEPVGIPLGDLLAVEVVSKLDAERETVYVLTVRWRDGADEHDARLAEWKVEEQAEQLAALIRSRTGLQAPSEPEA
jgi:hypothetical protein